MLVKSNWIENLTEEREIRHGHEDPIETDVETNLVVDIDSQRLADLSIIVPLRMKARGSLVDLTAKEERVIEGSNLAGE